VMLSLQCQSQIVCRDTWMPVIWLNFAALSLCRKDEVLLHCTLV
jgi:hypothetical protein